MPDQMMHIAISHMIIDKLDISDEGSFYLGSISPDAIHSRKESTRAEKSAYHFHSGSRNSWISNAEEFIKDYITGNESSFYKGYASHILTDILWAYGPFTIFHERYKQDMSPVLPPDKAYYYDLRRIDYEVYIGLNDIERIFEKLASSTALPIEGGPTVLESIEWREHVISRYTTASGGFDTPPRYLATEEIYTFFEEACEFIANYLL